MEYQKTRETVKNLEPKKNTGQSWVLGVEDPFEQADGVGGTKTVSKMMYIDEKQYQIEQARKKKYNKGEDFNGLTKHFAKTRPELNLPSNFRYVEDDDKQDQRIQKKLEELHAKRNNV